MGGRLRWYHLLNLVVVVLLVGSAGPGVLLFFLPLLGVLAGVTAVHEGGHAVAALAVGHRVSKIQLGIGPTLLQVRNRLFHFVVTWFPIGGYTVSHTPDPDGYRWRRAVVVAGGLVTNFVMILVAARYTSGTARPLLIVVNTLTIMENLWPRRIRTPMGDQYTDGLSFVMTLRLSDEEVAEATALSYLVDAQLASEAGDVDAAAGTIAAGLDVHPDNTSLLNWLAVQQVRRGDYVEAAQNLRTLATADGINAQQVAIYRNNLAWALLMHGDPADVSITLEESAAAIEELPQVSSIIGTRGFALIAAGSRREGITLCRRALSMHTEKGEKATNAAALAIGWAGEWSLVESERALGQARRLDPACPLLPRAAAAVAGLPRPGGSSTPLEVVSGSMDLVLRGAWLVDGTGAPARAADVGVEGGRITAVGDVGAVMANGAEEVDLDGLVLAPGFVDIHTHYDAQATWDPDLTPSSWHGVTTVVMGNCGFGIAPTRPEHRAVIARTLENVEGMSVEALTAGIDWTFETFPQYLDALDTLPKRLNVAALIGHTPLRLYVLGDEATERAATDDEIEQMRSIVAEAIAAGAVGFATSKSPTHSGDGGKPVPSRMAEVDEIRRIASALGDAGRGVVQITPGPGFFIDQFAELSAEIGRPVTWTALLTGMNRGTPTKLLERQAGLGGEVWPQIACRPLVMQVTMEDPFPFGMVPAFKEVLAAPRDARADVYADPAWRDRARDDLNKFWGHAWPKTTIQESERHAALVDGPSLIEIAAERGVDPADAICDLALEEGLRTRFRIVLANDDEVEIADLLRDGRAVLGLSDAGAHASQLCDACYSTHLLSHWVRDVGAISLERAVWRLTGHGAQVFRLEDRGVVRLGAHADLVAFDPDTIGAGKLERVHDLPAGADRLISRSTGVEHVWVNGEAIRRNGADVAASHPGTVIRGGTA